MGLCDWTPARSGNDDDRWGNTDHRRGLPDWDPALTLTLRELYGWLQLNRRTSRVRVQVEQVVRLQTKEVI